MLADQQHHSYKNALCAQNRNRKKEVLKKTYASMLNADRKIGVCDLYRKSGECKYGKDCKFSHDGRKKSTRNNGTMTCPNELQKGVTSSKVVSENQSTDSTASQESDISDRTATEYCIDGCFSMNALSAHLPHIMYPGNDKIMMDQQVVYASSVVESSENSYYPDCCWLSGQVQTFIRDVDRVLDEKWDHQENIIKRIRGQVKSVFGKAKFEVFGSTSTGLALPSSDIDGVIIPNGNRRKGNKEDYAIHTLSKVKKMLMPLKGLEKIELVEKAKIPVLKIVFRHDRWKNTYVDVTSLESVEHRGIKARDIVTFYMQFMPALRPLVLFFKSYLRKQDLNNPYTGGLSSYALVLLCIRFLQYCGYAHFSINDTASPMTYMFSRPNGPSYSVSIGALVFNFLEFYTKFQFQYYGISVENGGQFYRLMTPSSVVPDYSNSIPWIDDPVQPGTNVCKTFRMYQVVYMWKELLQQLCKKVPLDRIIGSDVREQ